MNPSNLPHLRPSSPPRRGLLTLAACLVLPGVGLAQTVLFSDDFETDTSAQWSVFEGSADGVPDAAVQWAYDYSAFRYVANGVTNAIPPAPNSSGTTRGVWLAVNKDEVEAVAGLSLFPTGRTFSGEYALKADLWLNYNGTAFGGTGSTEFATFGINHQGTQPVWGDANFNGDGVWFAVAGEGGASRDYRAYVGDGASPSVELLSGDGGFLDRDTSGSPEVEVNPAAADDRNPLKFILPSPPGETPGAPGKQWVQVEVRQRLVGTDPLVTWLINGHVIAEHFQGVAFGQTAGNIMIGTMDVFASLAVPGEENFALFDNVRVVSLDGVPPNPVVAIVAEDADAAEPADTASLTVSRQGDTSQPLTVGLRVLGTALPDADYEALPSSVTLPAGQESVTLTVTPKDDPNGEGDETIIVALAGSDTYDVRVNNAAIITLRDDGDVPAASVAAVSPIAYELAGTRPGRIAVNLSTPSFSDVTVSYSVSGTAVSGTDFEALSGTILIPAEQTRVLLPIVPRDNSAIDGDRTVIVTLTAGTGYKLGTDITATVTLRNDDLPAGQVLFTETFETDASSRWTVNQGPGDGVADLFFDYSTVGVPPAPGSGNSTRGLKLQANLAQAVFSGLSVSPTGGQFPGNIRLRFNLWQNYNGPLPAGGSGSTQITGAGVGTAGTSAQWPAGTQDSVWFATTGDGGSTVDYRAYSPAAPTGYGDASGVFAAGTTGNPRDAGNPYYAEFGRNPAPETQVASFPGQTGESAAGTQAFQWHDVVIEKAGGTVTWWIDGLRLASVSLTDVTLGGDNILLLHSDINAGSSTDPNATEIAFGLFDNIRVEAIEAPSGPATLTSIRLAEGNVILEFTGAASDAPSAFRVEAAATVTGPYTTEAAATVSQVAPGQFRAQVPATGTVRFYQIVR